MDSSAIKEANKEVIAIKEANKEVIPIVTNTVEKRKPFTTEWPTFLINVKSVYTAGCFELHHLRSSRVTRCVITTQTA